MAVVRFVSTRDPDLDLPNVPVTFSGGVADIDAGDTQRIERLRFLGAPRGVREIGVLGDDVTPPQDPAPGDVPPVEVPPEVIDDRLENSPVVQDLRARLLLLEQQILNQAP